MAGFSPRTLLLLHEFGLEGRRAGLVLSIPCATLASQKGGLPRLALAAYLLKTSSLSFVEQEPQKL